MSRARAPVRTPAGRTDEEWENSEEFQDALIVQAEFDWKNKRLDKDEFNSTTRFINFVVQPHDDSFGNDDEDWALMERSCESGQKLRKYSSYTRSWVKVSVLRMWLADKEGPVDKVHFEKLVREYVVKYVGERYFPSCLMKFVSAGPIQRNLKDMGKIRPDSDDDPSDLEQAMADVAEERAEILADVKEQYS
jgi:hypothetical protein